MSVVKSVQFTMNYRYIVALLVVLALAPVSVTHAQVRGFDSATLRLQAKADNLYRKGHWERAHFIYVNELAARGDKYSQYMAGYMCLHGKGVERDKIRASAWFRLAAEREGEEFVAVRDQILESMSEEEKLASDAIFVDLRRRYSDLVLLLDEIVEDRAARNAKPTGSRLPGSASSITVVDPRTGDRMPRSELMRRLDTRVQAQLDFLAEKVGGERLDADMTDDEFAELRERVDDYLLVVNDR